MAIAFTVIVTDRDWDNILGGWRCPALKIPGAIVDGVFASGTRADPAWYNVLDDHAVVRWVPPNHPLEAAISLKLNKELSTQELTLRWKKLAIILPLLSSILVALITVGFPHMPALPGHQVNTPKNDNPTITVIYPPSKAEVNLIETITGEAQNIPLGEVIWVVIYSYPDHLYYPHHTYASVGADGIWKSSDTIIGATEDAGKDFDIIALLADNTAQQQFNKYFEFTDRSGLSSLPNAAKEYCRVMVKRK